MTVRLAWLIDANVVSEMMRPRPAPRVAAFLDSIADDGLGIASVTVWELLNGFGRLGPGQRRREFAEQFRDLLDDLFEERVIAWSAEDAQACARIMENKRRRGEPLDDHVPEAFLAAAASVRAPVIVTRNPAEFRDTGVETADPWTGHQS